MPVNPICPTCRQEMETLPTRPGRLPHFYCREENLFWAEVGRLAAGSYTPCGYTPCEDPTDHIIFHPAAQEAR